MCDLDEPGRKEVVAPFKPASELFGWDSRNLGGGMGHQETWNCDTGWEGGGPGLGRGRGPGSRGGAARDPFEGVGGGRGGE